MEQAGKLREAGIDVQSGAPAQAGQLNYFKRLATGLPGVDVGGLSDLDVEALARHHGLSTNLLDWTSSPYIAAFFAFTTALDQANDGRLLSGTLDQKAVFHPQEPVCVWRLGITKTLWMDGEFELLPNLASVNYWQKAQWGVFTRLVHDEYLVVKSYLQSRDLLPHLMRFVVPGSETGKALGDLEAMNITYATLFPDLRGAALQANVGPTWKHLGMG